jgi:hypothetical protein
VKKIVVLAVVILSLALTAGAGAKPGYELANPASVCRDFLAWGVGGYSSFDQCTEMLMTDARNYRFFDVNGDRVSPFQMCEEYEAGFIEPDSGMFFQITYPFTFAEDPEWPFPVYTAHNTIQCGLTLFAYHTFVGVGGA